MAFSVRWLALLTILLAAGCNRPMPPMTQTAPAAPTQPVPTIPAPNVSMPMPADLPLELTSVDGPPSAPATKAATTVLFSITSDFAENPQSVDMAMKLAGFSLDEGRRVFVFFNVKGVRIPTNSFADDAAFGDEPPIKEQLRNLIKRGAEVHVCPVCMRGLKVQSTDILDDVTITTRPKLFANIGPNTVVFTY